MGNVDSFPTPSIEPAEMILMRTDCLEVQQLHTRAGKVPNLNVNVAEMMETLGLTMEVVYLEDGQVYIPPKDAAYVGNFGFENLISITKPGYIVSFTGVSPEKLRESPWTYASQLIDHKVRMYNPTFYPIFVFRKNPQATDAAVDKDAMVDGTLEEVERKIEAAR